MIMIQSPNSEISAGTNQSEVRRDNFKWNRSILSFKIKVNFHGLTSFMYLVFHLVYTSCAVLCPLDYSFARFTGLKANVTTNHQITPQTLTSTEANLDHCALYHSGKKSKNHFLKPSKGLGRFLAYAYSSRVSSYSDFFYEDRRPLLARIEKTKNGSNFSKQPITALPIWPFQATLRLFTHMRECALCSKLRCGKYARAWSDFQPL